MVNCVELGHQHGKLGNVGTGNSSSSRLGEPGGCRSWDGDSDPGKRDGSKWRGEQPRAGLAPSCPRAGNLTDPVVTLVQLLRGRAGAAQL